MLNRQLHKPLYIITPFNAATPPNVIINNFNLFKNLHIAVMQGPNHIRMRIGMINMTIG